MMEQTNLIVELTEVNKYFGENHVIKNFDLGVQPQEFVAIVGPSGTGKSTILNIIGLLIKADSGTVRLFGELAPSINSGKGRILLRNKISYLFQNAALIDQASVLANLKLSQSYSRNSKIQKELERREALDEVGLTAELNQKVYELSGGEQQRLALAQILLKPNSLILADEPTGSLDDSNRDVVLEILERLHRRGKTLIVVTHDPVVYQRADRIIELGN
jgi:putative ABC transport system ATP-binding protein